MSHDLLLALPLLAQVDDGSRVLLHLVTLLGGLGMFVFVFVGYLLFSSGWESYEEKYIEGAERTLDDLFLTIPPQQLLWLTILGGFGMLTVVFVLTDSLLVGAAAALPGGLAPRVALALLRRARHKKFNEQLVESMVTMTNALRSGVALPKAFQIVAHDMPKPICQEFGILVQEMRLGMDVEEAMESMLERMPGQDLQLVCTSVGISNSVGGNLAEVFERLAETIRERYRIEGRIDALTAQGKIQGLMVSVLPIFVGIMIYLIEPGMMSLMFTRVEGWVVLGVMVVMEGLGFFFVRKVTTIEV
ncbi:MAG: type II secretion system F family protein [Planctomycetes bacterium]|nr:type II secretion system F family protein [Planctomycetota bacterium]